MHAQDKLVPAQKRGSQNQRRVAWGDDLCAWDMLYVSGGHEAYCKRSATRQGREETGLTDSDCNLAGVCPLEVLEVNYEQEDPETQSIIQCDGTIDLHTTYWMLSTKFITA